MKAVVATFPIRALAEVASARLRESLDLPGPAISLGIVAAHHEAHDGHHLLAAWVPDDAEPLAVALLTAAGGVLHHEPV